MVYNAYVAKYMGNDTPKRNIATFDADIEKYGVGSKVHTSLVILNECYDMFPQHEHAISELENEIRWIGNQWGSELIEKKIENILKLDAAKNLCTIEQVLAAAYPRQATAVSFSREVADQLTLILYGEEGNGTNEANASKHIFWSAYTTSEIGQIYTRLFTNAHEFGWHSENRNDPEAMKMDLHNNQRGRFLGSLDTWKDILTLVMNDIAEGNAAILVDGKSVLNRR